jgi:hypothetical protein
MTNILHSAASVYEGVNLAGSDTTNTLCSIDEYLAPEVVQAAHGSTRMVDFWPHGGLVFTMVRFSRNARSVEGAHFSSEVS